MKLAKQILSLFFCVMVIYVAIKILSGINLDAIQNRVANCINEKIEIETEELPFPESAYKEPELNTSNCFPKIDTWQSELDFQNWFNYYCS